MTTYTLKQFVTDLTVKSLVSSKYMNC